MCSEANYIVSSQGFRLTTSNFSFNKKKSYFHAGDTSASSCFGYFLGYGVDFAYAHQETSSRIHQTTFTTEKCDEGFETDDTFIVVVVIVVNIVVVCD